MPQGQPPKKRRAFDIARGKRVSGSAKAKILRDIHELGLPDAVSESTLIRDRKKLVHVDTSFGRTIQTVKLPKENGGEIGIPFQHPAAILHYTLRQCPDFKHLFAKLLTTVGTSLRIILYNDEITPGNVLLQNNDRKCTAIYWT